VQIAYPLHTRIHTLPQLKVELVDVNSLKPHPGNPRIHPDSAIDKLSRSIKKFGWTSPVLVSADGYILAGHARLIVAKKAGVTKVPVIYLPLKGSKAEAYMIADNRLQEDTMWELETLRMELERLKSSGIDLEITGFSEIELSNLFDEVTLDDLELDVNEPREPKQRLKKCPNCGREF
jgi:ParB-like chromosome segregation protein Spo0J